MDKQALLQRLMKTFLGEVEEHIRALDHDLVALERGPDASARPALVDTLFRTAHTLKGAARAVDIGALEAAAHHLESIFDVARGGTASLEPETFQLLFAAVDAIKDTSRRLAVGDALGDSPLEALLPRLKAVSGSSTTAPAPPTASLSRATPASPPRATPEVAPLPAVPAAPEEPAVVATKAESVRISSARLDRMLDLGGELLVVRRRAEARDADVARLLDMAKHWEGEWRIAQRTMRRGPRRHGDGVSPASDSSPAASLDVQENTGENLQRLTRQLDSLSASLRADRKSLDQVAEPLEAEVLRSRMMPFAEACEGLERAVRDVAQGAGKDVDLTIEGGEIEIDRSV